MLHVMVLKVGWLRSLEHASEEEALQLLPDAAQFHASRTIKTAAKHFDGGATKEQVAVSGM